MSQLNTLLNTSTDQEAARLLHTCCAADRWVQAVLLRRPFTSNESVLACAREAWSKMERADVLAAFKGHPQIGGDLTALREKYVDSSHAVTWSASEQASVANASNDVLIRLRDGNAAYLQRFGHIFIVCATGKTAEEMLALLDARLPNPPEVEFEIAAHEQEKITLLRLQKLGS